MLPFCPNSSFGPGLIFEKNRLFSFQEKGVYSIRELYHGQWYYWQAYTVGFNTLAIRGPVLKLFDFNSKIVKFGATSKNSFFP